METVEQRRNEFFSSVWNHSEDEFQTAFDERRDLSAAELTLIRSIMSKLDAGESDLQISTWLAAPLSNPTTAKQIEVLLQICGITRNKILQDIKASAGNNRRNLRLSSHLSLASHASTWNIAGPYLVKKLRRVLHHAGVTDPLNRMLQGLNQATWPGYIRQERAKRSGHEAEYRIATLLLRLGIPFAPEEKADNPLCRDAMWHGVSFDIIVPNIHQPTVCIKSTVHTSNIGQYGESKDHLEVDEARRMIDTLPPASRPTLVGFIDGIGFESNSAGLNGVLEKADEFCQFSTIWKLGVISAKRTNRKVKLYLEAQDKVKHSQFLARYSSVVDFENRPFTEGIEAGCGIIQVL